jgi:Zn-dependent metalloprotease
MTTNPYALNCIVPPYLLREIIDRGTPVQREWAAKTLQSTTLMYEQRNKIYKAERPLVAKTVTPGELRVVFDAQQGSDLPGIEVRREGDPPTSDPAVNEAYDGAGSTYNYYKDIHKRNSIDNQGLRIDSSVHYQIGYDNAFWNGEQMVYGDGDEDLPVSERIFNRFTIALDVIGHELTHGVMQYESALFYSGQSGALNESFSDVFGSLVKQYINKQTAAEADWIIGMGLFTARVKAQGVRSMKAPGTAYDDPLLGKDPQPATLSGYVNTPEDNGGVHINCGIPNHAFYVASVQIGGYAWEKMGAIWYAAMQKRLPSQATFQDAADITYTIAGELFGVNSIEQRAVQKGWSEVEINVQTITGNNGGSSSNASNPGCLTSLLGMFRPKTGS